jgi:hypothetical protein
MPKVPWRVGRVVNKGALLGVAAGVRLPGDRTELMMFREHRDDLRR